MNIAKQATIALLTDFGSEDGYVGAMKGRILTEFPGTTLVDISHAIRPYDIRQAAFCLNNSYPYFPEKTVFVVVVDPGVGTSRQGIVIKTSQYYFVGPDNGVFSYVFHREGYQAFRIDLNALPDDIANTFHGRDVFARIGAWLAAGKLPENVLSPQKSVQSFIKIPHKTAGNRMNLEVLHIDHFGNLVLNLHRQDWQVLESPETYRLVIKHLEFTTIRETFGDVPSGELLLLWDSSGYLQISKNQGDAAKTLQVNVGETAQLIL
ncbi:MAG: SAM-dependent chlorinase/fluorinase [Calditrichaeota bacterium]|nr:SAM-dependent chlorinase/fluorinase [Calditrichota bacterium]